MDATIKDFNLGQFDDSALLAGSNPIQFENCSLDGSLGFPASAFGIAMPLWASLALGDFVVKICIGIVALIPYGGVLKLSDNRAASV